MHFFTIFLATLSWGASSTDYNKMVLEAVNSMPDGGKYTRNQTGDDATMKSVYLENGELKFNVSNETPSFCTGATYVVFLKVIAELQKKDLALTPEMLQALMITGQPDGTDVWGRWNSNGPGFAKLFFDLGLGKNFVGLRKARPGDFLKIFFRPTIGKSERGHTVVYLGTTTVKGKPAVRYFSSNTPKGFGVHTSAMERIQYMLFTRLENPYALRKVLEIPREDAYLKSMLTVDETYEGMLKAVGVR